MKRQKIKKFKFGKCQPYLLPGQLIFFDGYSEEFPGSVEYTLGEKGSKVRIIDSRRHYQEVLFSDPPPTME